MKKIDKIPVGKIERATKLMGTGVKLGGNYLRFMGERMVDSEKARERLDESNAEDLYNSLKELKGSALKVAQMMSMDRNVLPKAYVDRFSLSQFQVPPLSGPLVEKTFRKSLGKGPKELFDHFESESIYAASIGQVHEAQKDGKRLAVKIQYPGVGDSIKSDLAIVKPIAKRMFNLKEKDAQLYFNEIEEKLAEETNYLQELEQGMKAKESCSHLEGLAFPSYYPEYSSDKILTMDWMPGIHLAEFIKTNTDKEKAKWVGQHLWDFYMYQIHHLKKVHADPHPGNFLVQEDGTLVVLDFGCMKEIPQAFYVPYFELANSKSLDDPSIFEQKLIELEILKPTDSEKEKDYLKSVFYDLLSVLTEPVNSDFFDFGNPAFFDRISSLSDTYSKDGELRKMDGGRGSRHFLYINRSFFGLYSLLHDLKVKIEVNAFEKYLN